MIHNDEDEWLCTYFNDIALPIDMFHFKSKHKETNIDCSRYCNPAHWPKLHDGEKWRFNSLAAEQTNAWYGGFLTVVHDMQADRYEFFLDQMVKHQNRMIVKELGRKGKAPYNIPCNELMHVESDSMVSTVV